LQSFDEDTGTHYNYFRDYDPSVGRYLKSDSVGLRGGINTYLYVMATPLTEFDFRGLASDRGGSRGGRGGAGRAPTPFDVFVPGTPANDAFVRSFWQIICMLNEQKKEICRQACQVTFNAWISACGSMGEPAEILRCARQAQEWLPTCLAGCEDGSGVGTE
jgi:RHS repeat-associated protein